MKFGKRTNEFCLGNDISIKMDTIRASQFFNLLVQNLKFLVLILQEFEIFFFKLRVFSSKNKRFTLSLKKSNSNFD